MKNAGYEPIIRALGLLAKHPSLSAEQLHGLMPDVALATIVDWLRDFERTGLARIAHVVHVGPRMFVRHYSSGAGQSARWPHRSKDGGRSLSSVLTIAAMREAMSEPATVSEIVAEVGLDRRVAHRVLDLLRDAGMARVSAWVPDAYGRPCAAWSWGAGESARKPRPKSRKVTNARAWAKRRDKLAHLQLIAATAGQGCGPMVAAKVADTTNATLRRAA